MRKTQFVSVIGALAVAIALSACGSSDDESSGTDAGATVAADRDSEVTVTVDGEPVELTDKTVGCAEAAGKVNIGIGSATGTSAIGAVVTAGDSPEVESVALGATNGINFAYARGTGGSATATKDGNTYTISGEATGIDVTNPTETQTKPFEITVTCP